MENLTWQELAALNRLVKHQKARFQLDVSRPEYFQKPDDECPSFIQRSRKKVAELQTLQDKLELMMQDVE